MPDYSSLCRTRLHETKLFHTFGENNLDLPEGYAMKKCSFRNKQIAYQIEGEGHCLILLHGFPMDSRVWDGFGQLFGNRFKILRIDLPGFGQSDHIDENHDMPLMAAAVKAVLDKEKIVRSVIVGHSMGGYVALEFSNLYPEMVSGLVLFHSQAAGDDEQAQDARNETIIRVLNDKEGFIRSFVPSLFDPSFSANNPQAIEAIYNLSVSQSEKGIIAALAGMRDRGNHIHLLTKLRVPVLFILGKMDSRMPVVKIMAQAGLPHHAEMLLLDHVGHMGFMEKPKLTMGVISDFAWRCMSGEIL
jgi:pimeloyl-ACP methyl ester carboxylesterase